MHRPLLAAIASLAIVASARTAAAHQSSVKYLDLVVGGGRVEVALRVAASDVTEPMGLRPDARATVRDAAATPAVAPYVAGWVALAAHGQPCSTTALAARADDDGKLLVVAWTATCADPDELEIDLRRFFAVDQRHVAIVHVEAPNTEPADTIVRAGEPTLVLHVAASSLAWLRAGFDRMPRDGHAGFVIALLLVVVLARDGTAWRLRGFGPVVRRATVVLGAFTAAHVVGLAIGVLGLVALAPSLLAALTALSAVYAAIEDVAQPDARRRIALAAGFGVVHGLAFALAAPAVPGALASYTVGLELGQLMIASIALPVLYAAARALGATRYRRIALPLAAAILVAAAGFG